MTVETAQSKPAAAGAPRARFSSGDWFRLFLVCAFPLHLWTLLMAFRDVGWVAARTTAWDALGFSAYALFYTLIESILLFGFIALLSLLTPKSWPVRLKFGVLSLLAFALAGWSILEQLILIVFYTRLRSLAAALPWLVSPAWLPQAIFALLVALSVALPLWLLRRLPKLQAGFDALLERLALLSGLYLALDAIGIVIILIRNIFP